MYLVELFFNSFTLPVGTRDRRSQSKSTVSFATIKDVKESSKIPADCDQQPSTDCDQQPSTDSPSDVTTVVSTCSPSVARSTSHNEMDRSNTTLTDDR